MKIELEFLPTDKNLTSLRTFIMGLETSEKTEVPGQMSLFETAPQPEIETEPQPEIETAPQPEIEIAPQPEIKAEPQPKTAVTKTDVRAEALRLSKAGKQKELAQVFASFGCKKLSDFDNRTDDYSALLAALKEVQ